jgi:gluconate kinase
MPAKLLDSQMIDLEEPKGALTISISSSPPEIVEKILSNIGWS